MNKKITVLTVLFLAVSVVIFSAKEQQDLYLKAVAEKDLATKMELLKEYAEKYGEKKDKFLRFIYLNLCETAYKLQKYDEAIQYGETSLGYQDELDLTNKLNVLFYLANSYYVTKKDFDKALEYANTVVELSESLIKKMQESEQEKEKIEIFGKKYQTYYIAPAYRLQALIWYAKGKDNTENIKKAADNSLKAFEYDGGSENSYKLVFSLAGNLYGKNLYDEAIAVTEKIIDKENPKYKEVFFLANLYLKIKNTDRAFYYFEMAYGTKPEADLALRLGQMVFKKDIDKGIRYFADAYVLSQFDKESNAYKYLEHLYFNEKAKDQTPEQKEEGFKAIIDASRARLGIKETP